MDALSYIDQCFIADRMLEQLPTPSQASKTNIDAIDIKEPRMRWLIEAVTALSPERGGFTASQLVRIRALSKQSESENGPRRAAYDLRPGEHSRSVSPRHRAWVPRLSFDKPEIFRPHSIHSNAEGN